MAQLGRLYKYAQDSSGNAKSGVSLTIYREGATVNGAQSATGPTTFAITVRHQGKIKPSDTVFVNTTTSTSYTVTAVSATSISITLTSGTLNLADGDRIVPSNAPPSLYGDDQKGTTTTNPLTSSSTGLWQCFVEFGAYDMLQSGGGLSTVLHIGLVVGSEAPGQIRFADDFAANSVTGGIQEAIDDLPSAGGTVMCSGGVTYTIAGTTAATASIWLHSGVTLNLNSATIQRGTGSLTTATSVIEGCAKGSNGTLPTSASTLSNISIIGPGIVDGNESNFTSNVGVGITLRFTDGVVIDGVRIQNCEQDGLSFNECKNVRVNNLHIDTVGQASSATSRNAISLYNNGNSWSGANLRYVIENITISTVQDWAFSVLGVSDVVVRNMTVNACNSVLEFQTGASSATTAGNISISGVTATDCKKDPIYFSIANASKTWDRITISDCNFNGHASLFDGGSILCVDTLGSTVSNVAISNCNFVNINSKDTTAAPWINIQGQHASSSLINWSITDCNLTGKSGSTRTNDTGIAVKGNTSNIRLRNVTLKNIAGTGVSLATPAAITSVSQRIYLDNVIVDTCTNTPYIIGVSNANTTIKEVVFTNCIARDGNTQTDSKAFVLQTSAAGIIQDIKIINPKARNDSSTGMVTGIRLDNSGAGTLDNISVIHPDFRGMTNIATEAGTNTNVRIIPRAGRGTDILSAATITIPADGTIFHITAANNITNGLTVNSWDKGRQAVLVFDSTPTMSDTGTSVMAGNFVATADDTITFTCDGTNWYEMCRSIN